MFRGIKQELINQKRIARYFSYAAGEVILIVVGILFAVSINTWNEERHERKIVNGILSVLVNDLKQDRQEVSRIIDFYKSRQSTFLRVSHDSITQFNTRECDLCPGLISSRKLFSVNTRGLHQLNEYYNYTLGNKDTLVFDIVNFYTELIDEVENFNSMIDDDVVGNLIYWRDTYNWFARSIHEQVDRDHLSYFATQDYRNRVAYHYVLIYKNYLPILQEFEKNSEQILKALDERLKE